MDAVEKIHEQVSLLPPEKQREVLDFVRFLQQQGAAEPRSTSPKVLSRHPGFGAWRGRDIDALAYQQARRSEWDDRD